MINSFTANPITVSSANPNTTLSWSFSKAETASIDQGVGTITGPTGSKAVAVGGPSTTYTLTAKNALGAEVKKSVTVQVLDPPTIESFSANPIVVVDRGQTTLSWAVSGAEAITIPGVGTFNPASQSSAVVEVSGVGPHSYILEATNAIGKSTRDVTVQVVEGVAVKSFGLVRVGCEGGSVEWPTFCWSCSGGDDAMVTLKRDGLVIFKRSAEALSGQYMDRNVPISGSHTYSLEVRNSAGSTAQGTPLILDLEPCGSS